MCGANLCWLYHAYMLCMCCCVCIMALQVVAFQVRSAFPPEVDPLPAHAMDTAVVLPKPKASRNGPNSNTKRSSKNSSSSASAQSASATTITTDGATDGTAAGAAALEQQLEPMQIASDSDSPTTATAATDTAASGNTAVADAAAATVDSAAAAAAAGTVNNSSTNGSSSGGGSSDQRAAKGREMRELDYCGMLNRALPPEIRCVWHVPSCAASVALHQPWCFVQLMQHCTCKASDSQCMPYETLAAHVQFCDAAGYTCLTHFLIMLFRHCTTSIRCLAWAPVTDEFSARFSCRERVYRYFFIRKQR
jgi:hypothetical protein